MTAPTIDTTTGEILTPGARIDLLRTAIGLNLTALLDHAQGSDDPAEVARALCALRDLKADAATVYSDIEEHLLACMGERTLEVPGLGLFETKRRTKRTAWRIDELVDAVLRAEAGDEPALEGMVAVAPVGDTARALRECISFGAGKVTGLRARGLQPDEFCNETPDGWSVQLPPRDHGNDVA